MDHDCDICGGRRVIKLRALKRARAVTTKPSDCHLLTAPEDEMREYPCPECGAKTDQDHINVLEVFHRGLHHGHGLTGEHKRSFERQAAHALVDLLLHLGYIRSETRVEDDPRYGRVHIITSTLGAVSVTNTSTIQARIKENQFDVADKVANMAATEIIRWGPHYHGSEGRIRKDMASRFVFEALNKCKAYGGTPPEV